VLALAALAVSSLSVSSVTTEHKAFKRYVAETDARQKLASTVLDAANARAIAARNLVLVTAAADRESEKTAAALAHETVGRRLAQLKDALARGAGVEDEERRLFADLEAVEAKYGALALGIMDLALKDQREQAIAKMNAECRPLLAALVAATQRYAEHGHTRAAAEVAQAEASFSAARALLVVTCGASLLLAVGMGWALTRAITRPIERAVRVARTVAAGDLSSAIEAGGRDETGQLLAALKVMNDSLAGIVSNVRVA
jgi:methyl-accepting chemotaxis protein-1 (serine sensor receptor)